MIHAVRVLNVCGWLINLMLKTRKNVSVEKCKQIIEKAEQGREVEIHKPTISHYWDKENGMKNGLDRGNYIVVTSKELGQETFYVKNCEAILPYLMYLGYNYNQIGMTQRIKTAIPKNARFHNAQSFDNMEWLNKNRSRFEKWLKGEKVTKNPSKRANHKNPKFKETGDGTEHESNVVAKYDVGAGISMSTFLTNIAPYIKIGETVRLHWKGKDFLWLKKTNQSWSKVVPNAVRNVDSSKLKSLLKGQAEKAQIEKQEKERIKRRVEDLRYEIKHTKEEIQDIKKSAYAYGGWTYNMAEDLGFYEGQLEDLTNQLNRLTGKPKQIIKKSKPVVTKKGIQVIKKQKPNYSNFDFDYDKKFDDLSKMFLGKANGEKRNVLASDLQPSRTVRGGKLHKLLINGLNGKKYEIDSFGSDAWFSFDRRKNLWFSGKDARLNLKSNGIKLANNQMHCLGYLDKVHYIVAKKHLENGELVEWHHKLGEVNKELPSIWVDADGFFIVVGGDYDIWKEGIVN
jgi:hypothetical protein